MSKRAPTYAEAVNITAESIYWRHLRGMGCLFGCGFERLTPEERNAYRAIAREELAANPTTQPARGEA